MWQGRRSREEPWGLQVVTEGTGFRWFEACCSWRCVWRKIAFASALHIAHQYHGQRRHRHRHHHHHRPSCKVQAGNLTLITFHVPRLVRHDIASYRERMGHCRIATNALIDQFIAIASKQDGGLGRPTGITDPRKKLSGLVQWTCVLDSCHWRFVLQRILPQVATRPTFVDSLPKCHLTCATNDLVQSQSTLFKTTRPAPHDLHWFAMACACLCYKLKNLKRCAQKVRLLLEVNWS